MLNPCKAKAIPQLLAQPIHTAPEPLDCLADALASSSTRALVQARLTDLRPMLHTTTCCCHARPQSCEANSSRPAASSSHTTVLPVPVASSATGVLSPSVTTTCSVSLKVCASSSSAVMRTVISVLGASSASCGSTWVCVEVQRGAAK